MSNNQDFFKSSYIFHEEIQEVNCVFFFHGCCRDPIPVPEKVRKPLTQVQEFSLRLNHRAIDRAQFDERVMKHSLTVEMNRDSLKEKKRRGKVFIVLK